MAGISQTRTISHYNTTESHLDCITALLCGTYQPRLCALELLPKEFTGGISDDLRNPGISFRVPSMLFHCPDFI